MNNWPSFQPWYEVSLIIFTQAQSQDCSEDQQPVTNEELSVTRQTVEVQWVSAHAATWPQQIHLLLYVKLGVQWQAATVNSLTESPSSSFFPSTPLVRLSKQRWGQPWDTSLEEHSKAQNSQLEHTSPCRIVRLFAPSVGFQRAASPLVPRQEFLIAPTN